MFMVAKTDILLAHRFARDERNAATREHFVTISSQFLVLILLYVYEIFSHGDVQSCSLRSTYLTPGVQVCSCSADPVNHRHSCSDAISASLQSFRMRWPHMLTPQRLTKQKIISHAKAWSTHTTPSMASSTFPAIAQVATLSSGQYRRRNPHVTLSSGTQAGSWRLFSPSGLPMTPNNTMRHGAVEIARSRVESASEGRRLWWTIPDTTWQLVVSPGPACE